MLKYIQFGVRLILTSFFLKTTNYFGNLPFKSTPGTVYKVISGGMFKFNEMYVYTFNEKWLLFDSNEEEVKTSKEYVTYQVKIIEDLQNFKQNLDQNTKI